MVTTTVVEPACGVGRVDIAIRLFGEVGGAVDGHVIPVLATPRMTRLLARLVLLEADVWVSREQLARELWPDSDAAQARTNLRKLIHNLRRSLPGPPHVVDAAGDRVRWSAGPAVWVDVVAFLDALAQGDPAGAMGSFGGDCCRAVTTTGSSPSASGCGAWPSRRSRASPIRPTPRAVIPRSSSTPGACTIDPLHERACRLLMQALTRQGERGEALRSYERLAERLGTELGVAPEPVTTAMADRLRRAGQEECVTSALVGRTAEWQAAHDAWRAASGGRAGVLCVAGEAGIGKSRLVEELARRVARDGDAVVYSRAYEAASRPPWGSVIDWLRSGPVATCLDTLDPACLTELARLLPELRLAHPGLPVAPPATDPGRRHHLLVAGCRGLLATGRPLLLVVDDLQWCDADTVELCEILVRSAPSAPVLIVATVRDEEAAGTQLLDRWRRQLAPTVISLGPLDRPATAEMAALVGGRVLTPEAAASCGRRPRATRCSSWRRSARVSAAGRPRSR